MRSLLRKPFRALYYSLYGKTGKDVLVNNERYRVSAHISRGVSPINDEIPYRLLKNLTAGADVVLDIGANVGIISVLIAGTMKGGSKIYSFEPVPSTFKMLADNARVQKGNATIVPYNLAISNSVGDVYFTNRSEHTVNNILSNRQEDSILVKSTTVDAFCSEHHIAPQVIKIDVEGAEFFALEGMVRTLRENDCVVLVEIHSGMLKDFGIDSQKFTTLLNEIGYQLYNELGERINNETVLNNTCVVLSSQLLDKSLFAIA